MECSRDYDANDEVTRLFYKTVQNKLHWAIHRHTAAELIAERAKAALPHMGLTTWKNAPDGKVLKSDVTVAKNYLNAEEISELDRIVGMYLDYAENQAKRGITMYMKDWAGKLDAFLQFNDYNVLKDAGKVSHDVAVQLAEGEYEKFRVRQDRDHISDFDKEVRRLTGGGPVEPKTPKTPRKKR